MTDTTQPAQSIFLQRTAIRLLAEVRQSRHTKATTYRKRFGDRMPKNFEAEVSQMEAEVEAIDILTKAIEAGEIF